MVRRAALVIVALIAATAIAISATPAGRATHWCGDATVIVSPPIAEPNATTTFQVRVMYGGNGTLILTRVALQFSWETGERDLGSGSISSGGSRTFPVVATPTGSGPWSVDARLLGQAPGDSVEGLCTYSVPIARVSQDFFASLSFLGLVLLVCAVIVVAIIIVVIAVLVLLAKRPPTHAVYPYPPPVAPPPWPPPSYPPPSPPAQPPQPPRSPGAP